MTWHLGLTSPNHGAVAGLLVLVALCQPVKGTHAAVVRHGHIQWAADALDTLQGVRATLEVGSSICQFLHLVLFLL